MSTKSDKKLLLEFEEVKDDDENFIWLGKPEWKSFTTNMIVSGIIGMVLLAGFFIVYSYVGKDKENLQPSFAYIILAIVFIPGIIKYITSILSYKNTFYGFSNKRIMMKGGFWETEFKMIDYDKIIDIELKVNPIDKIFNTGTLKFFSGKEETDNEGNTRKIHDSWRNIENVYEVFKQVKKVMVDIKTDYNYPNAKRPPINPGYKTKYEPE